MTESTNNSAPEEIAVKPQKSTSGLSIFALLISLLALGATAFSWYQTEVQRVTQRSDLVVGVTKIGGEVTRLGDAIARLQSNQSKLVSEAQLSTRVLESTHAFDQQINALKQTQNVLQSAIEKINGDMQKGVNDLVIDEVSQLLKLANNSAIFNGDAASAIKALGLADSQLKALADPRFSEVRRTINQELALLNSIEVVDVERVSVQLNTLSKRIAQLPLENEPPAQERVNLLKAVPEQEDVSWRTELRRMWRDIINSVQVQRVDQPPKPLLAPQQRYFLNQNIQLMLSKAELAMLQRSPAIYAHSLNDAQQWLNEYFDLQNSDVQEVLNELSALMLVNVSRELPPVVGSYDMLQSIKGGL